MKKQTTLSSLDDPPWSCPRLGFPVSPHDWPEDDKSENGGYECRCIYCNSIFYGHKRRVVCKVCGTKPISEENAELTHPDPKPKDHE